MFDIAHILTTYGYTGMFFASLSENGIFFFLPGDSMLIASGVLASADMFDVNYVVAIYIIGSTVGNLIGYEIGKRLEIWREKNKFIRSIFKDKYIEEAHYAFAKYGDRIVLVQRYIPIIRTFGPMIAGAVGMRYSTFVTYSIIGGIVWSVSLVYPSYWLGNRVPGLENHIEMMVIIILGVTMLPIIYQLIKRQLKKAK